MTLRAVYTRNINDLGLNIFSSLDCDDYLSCSVTIYYY